MPRKAKTAQPEITSDPLRQIKISEAEYALEREYLAYLEAHALFNGAYFDFKSEEDCLEFHNSFQRALNAVRQQFGLSEIELDAKKFERVYLQPQAKPRAKRGRKPKAEPQVEPQVEPSTEPTVTPEGVTGTFNVDMEHSGMECQHLRYQHMPHDRLQKIIEDIAKANRQLTKIANQVNAVVAIL
jgi:hypothetical protein